MELDKLAMIMMPFSSYDSLHLLCASLLINIYSQSSHEQEFLGAEISLLIEFGGAGVASGAVIPQICSNLALS